MRYVALALGVLCALATAAVVLVVRSGSVSSVMHPASVTTSGTATGPGTTSPGENSTPSGGESGLPQVGIVTDSLKNFQEATSAYPAISVHFLSWGTPFPGAIVLDDRRLGATTLLVLEPQHVSLSGIAAGQEDAYLKAFASAERNLGLPILISYAPEANGSWYPWGANHITPTLYIEMWRRVHDVIQKNGGTKITWLWQMNVPWPTSEALSLLWPGSRYVNEVGIDGQITSFGETFSSVFGLSLTEIRRITGDPILLSEVAVKVGPEMPQVINTIFNGACHDHLEGVILFDVHKEWQFDGNAQAVAAFKRDATIGCRDMNS
jgi:hypothetical protein